MAFFTAKYVPRSKEKTVEISMDEFMRWLKRFDADGDGRISANELREAIRFSGGWFNTTAKAHRILNSVDSNSNGFIDENEINKLLGFAHKHFGYKIVV